MDLQKLSINELEQQVARGITQDAVSAFVELMRRELARSFEALAQSSDQITIYRNQGEINRIKWILKQFKQ